MGKGSFKGKSKGSDKSTNLLKSGSSADILDGLICFSFKFYDANNPRFDCKDREAGYFQVLLERMRDLSAKSIRSLIQAKPDSTTRFHRIDFGKQGVSEAGFGLKGWEEYDNDAWQFSLSANEHGRVHGFLIENVFYVVWLDPRHKLYSGK